MVSQSKDDAESRLPPEKLPFGERFSRYMHDQKENTYMGRTPESWGM